VDVRDALDDAVDAVIERALAGGGRVVFTPNGSLAAWDRIALLPRKGESR
jgi:sugar/nucleoside kinase (ribokinase family)